jgi:GDP-L-fucose synthase
MTPVTDLSPVLFPLQGRRIFVAGHRGLVGGALARRLARIDCEVLTAARGDLDLRRQAEVERWMGRHRPDAVFVAAATVGGIFANDTRPAEFLYDNMMIEANVIEAARQVGVAKLQFLGSTCTYPRLAQQPMREDDLLTGPLEPTNQWYAIAKIAGMKLCAAYRRQWGCDFIASMPTNIYGPGDRFDLRASHVVPALMMKMHKARVERADAVEIWGTGKALREFLHVDDVADSVVFLMERYSDESPINIGSGAEISIGDLARLMAEVVGFEGRLDFAVDKPDGMPRKLVDNSRMAALGWRPGIALREGLAGTYDWYLRNVA